MRHLTEFRIGEHWIGEAHPTYFIADLASNHDGQLERAKRLTALAAQAGANAVKFQHFLARELVSDVGFRSLGGRMGHQASWSEGVYATYERFQLPREWTDELARVADDEGVTFMTTPYDEQAVELTSPLVPAIKIGSGDITHTRLLERIASQGKPVLLAAGASTEKEVVRAVDAVLRHNDALCLMQCNTNYTGSDDNFRYVNLRVLTRFAELWPGMPVGLSDHTRGHATVLGAIALGARAVEKHFTDDTTREGPDHGFSMDPASWRDMVDRARDLEAALGDGVKRVEANEVETAVVQRRCIRAARELPAGSVIGEGDLAYLRPAPEHSLPPHASDRLVGRTARIPIGVGVAITPDHLA
jgi:N-acetylneuraminate synthase